MTAIKNNNIKNVNLLLSGSSVGAALTFPMCGYIIHWFGWPVVFYLSGIVGTIWFILWWVLVHDSPADHPTISESEKNYIQKEIGKTITDQKVDNQKTVRLDPMSPTANKILSLQIKPPWGHIMRSKSIWMTTLAQWGGIWGLFTLMTQAPTYLKYIHGWDIRSVKHLLVLRVLASHHS